MGASPLRPPCRRDPLAALVAQSLTAEAGVLEDPGRNPWDTAYRLGEDEKARLGDFAPHWVYPGAAKGS